MIEKHFAGIFTTLMNDQFQRNQGPVIYQISGIQFGKTGRIFCLKTVDLRLIASRSIIFYISKKLQVYPVRLSIDLEKSILYWKNQENLHFRGKFRTRKKM